ncbi:MAG: S8 family serine peptidase [Sumerlaeia bacterium]
MSRSPSPSAAELAAQSIELTKAAHRRTKNNVLPATAYLDYGGLQVRADLQRLSPTGKPVFYQPLSANVAISAGANLVHQAPYHAQGEGIIGGHWDQYVPLLTHQEFAGPSGVRVTLGDSITMPGHHATATAGVMIAAGANSAALGMAPQGLLRSFCYDFDEPEALANAATSTTDTMKLRVSNHSYGDFRGWITTQTNLGGGYGWYWVGEGWLPGGAGNREDMGFGGYGDNSVFWDTLAYEAPYYLHVRSAGNDRSDNYKGSKSTGTFFYWNGTQWTGPEPYVVGEAPYDDKYDNNWDTLIEEASAKNILAVGAMTDAVTAGERDFSAAAFTSFSGWGPVDDGRIKPDITANGYKVVLAVAIDDASYSSGTSNGTSFSSPSVAGVAMLVLQKIEELLDGTWVRASTLKAILLHSAYDVGNAGPDYKSGWGHVDAINALDQVTSFSLSPGANGIVEDLLEPANPQSAFAVDWDGTSELRATIVWTDPPSPKLMTMVDNPTPALVHDLDLRIVGPGSTTYYPYRLDKSDPGALATTGDNVVDNVEQVRIAALSAPAGAYTIQVSHKGTLAYGEQWFSLIVSGQEDAAAPAPSLPPAVAPSYDPNGKAVIEASGGGFQLGAQVTLVHSVSGDVILCEGEAGSPRLLAGEADLTGVRSGFYDMIVSNPDGQSATLSNAVFVNNLAPVLNALPASLTLKEGETTETLLSASDGNLPEQLTFSTTGAPDFASIGGASAGNPATASMALAPDFHSQGSWLLTVTATDDGSPAASTSHDLTVEVLNVPTLLDAVALSPTEVRVTFDSAMAQGGPGSVLNPDAFSIVASIKGSKGPATVDVLSVDGIAGDSVVLTTAPQNPGQSYILTVSQTVTDSQGNTLATETELKCKKFMGFQTSSVTDWEAFE